MLRRRLLALPLALFLAAPLGLGAQYKPKYTVEQFLSPPFPLVFASAKKADRIAWVGYDRGKRNVYTAAAPGLRVRTISKKSSASAAQPSGLCCWSSSSDMRL